MQLAARVSHAWGYASKEFVERQRVLCARAGLPVVFDDAICGEKFAHFLQRDKKNAAGQITLIVAQDVGNLFVLPGIPIDRIKESFQDILFTDSKGDENV
jgi:3-dehydroquinate synthetase